MPDLATTVLMVVAVAGCLVQECVAQPLESTAENGDELLEPKLLALRDPELKLPDRIRRLSSSYLELWIECLSGPEYELRREVARNITRAHREGFLDCSSAVDSLTAAMNDPATPRSVLVELARALITLDARDAAAKFKATLKQSPDIQFEMVVEPALARWGDVEMLEIWQQRLRDENAPRYRRLLALRAIANLPQSMTTDEKLHTDLRTLIVNRQHKGTVLEAARTLGQIKQAGSEPLARQLLEQPNEASLLELLAAVYLVHHHESKSSQQFLLRIITDSLNSSAKATAIRLAWRRLLTQQVAELESLASNAIAHSDPEIRRAAIDTMIQFPSSEHVALLGKTLDDQHPEIRRAARQALWTLSQDEALNSEIRKAGQAAINRSSWREQEQAIVLLAMLNQSDAANRMLSLISSPRPEVTIAAAWGLRKLNVPAMSKSLLSIAEALDKQIADGPEPKPHELTMLAHTFEALGNSDYKPATPLLKRWISKSEPRVNYEIPRYSAVWAIGRIHEGSEDTALATQLKQRFLDVDSFLPETSTVRYTAGIALGRIGFVQVVPDLKTFARIGNEEADLAAAWSVERLTGEVFPPPKPQIESGALWRVVPIGSRLNVNPSSR